MNKLLEEFDWFGVALILVAYGLVSFAVVAPTSVTYQLMNAVGSLGIAAASWRKKDYQPVALNAVWLLVALVSLARSFVR